MSDPTANVASGVPGAAFLLEENHDLPLVRLQISTRTGAATDGHGTEGMAPVVGLGNFATELMRRGAAGKSRAAIDEALDQLGASLQVVCWHDSVLFEVLALKDNIDDAAGLLADVVLRPDFPQDEADRLRRELHATLDDMRDDDGTLMQRFFARALYSDHPYGQPVSGTNASIDQLDVALARAWHRRYLTTGNLIFGVAGALTPDEGAALLARHFATAPAGPRRDSPLPLPPQPSGRRLVVVDKPERTQSQILVGQLAPHWSDPAWLPLQVATTAFGGTFTARLNDEVRVKRGLSYGASARVGNGRGRRALTAHVFPSAEQTPETLELVLRLYEEWAQGGLHAEELAFARSYLAKSHAFSIQTPEDRLNLRTRLLLSDMPLEHLQTFPARVSAVTAEAVGAAMTAHLRPSDLLITLVATAKVLVPRLQEVAALHGATIEVVPYDSF